MMEQRWHAALLQYYGAASIGSLIVFLVMKFVLHSPGASETFAAIQFGMLLGATLGNLAKYQLFKLPVRLAIYIFVAAGTYLVAKYFIEHY